MTDPASLVLMAKIGAPHGVKGEVRVKPFTADPMALDDYGALRSSDGRRFKIKRFRADKTVLVVKFEGFNSREEAVTITGTELYIERHRLPPVEDEDEFYVTDLVGMDVVNREGTALGTVTSVDDFGAGDVLEVKMLAGKPLLISFTHANVPEVDLAARKIVVVPPPEMGEVEPAAGSDDPDEQDEEA